MGRLEERAFGIKRETLIKSEDKNSEKIENALRKCIIRGDYLERKKYEFSFDRLYD